MILHIVSPPCLQAMQNSIIGFQWTRNIFPMFHFTVAGLHVHLVKDSESVFLITPLLDLTAQ